MLVLAVENVALLRHPRDAAVGVGDADGIHAADAGGGTGDGEVTCLIVGALAEQCGKQGEAASEEHGGEDAVRVRIGNPQFQALRQIC